MSVVLTDTLASIDEPRTPSCHRRPLDNRFLPDSVLEFDLIEEPPPFPVAAEEPDECDCRREHVRHRKRPPDAVGAEPHPRAGTQSAEYWPRRLVPPGELMRARSGPARRMLSRSSPNATHATCRQSIADISEAVFTIPPIPDV